MNSNSTFLKVKTGDFIFISLIAFECYIFSSKYIEYTQGEIMDIEFVQFSATFIIVTLIYCIPNLLASLMINENVMRINNKIMKTIIFSITSIIFLCFGIPIINNFIFTLAEYMINIGRELNKFIYSNELNIEKSNLILKIHYFCFNILIAVYKNYKILRRNIYIKDNMYLS